MRNLLKPEGWWTAHPTMLTLTVHGAFDSNGDGLGDFEGIQRNLEWFQALGISGFRFQHVGEYGNDYTWSGLVQQNWYQVDPHYGSMQDFERFMLACDEQGMKVMMMAVPEYLGWQHPDYLAAKRAKEAGEQDKRISWFDWKDDGTVLTCWNRPAPKVSNPGYMDAFLHHIGFWMDKGVAGWDADAVMTWHGISAQALRQFTKYVVSRGGMVTAENMVLERDLTKYGGFNAGTGHLRFEFYNELRAIMEGRADYIREGMAVRQQLIAQGMFPYQQFGDQSFAELSQTSFCHLHEMYKQQIAFNAVLPDQVWINAAALTFTEIDPNAQWVKTPHGRGWGAIDWTAVRKQEGNPNSIFEQFRRMFSLRARHAALGIGEMKEVDTDQPKQAFAAIRTSEDGCSRALVIFNFDGQPCDVVINLAGLGIAMMQNALSGAYVEVVGPTHADSLLAYGYKVYLIDDAPFGDRRNAGC